MKKLFLTACAVALFSAAAIGQEEQYRPLPEIQDTTDYQDTTGIEPSDRYRQDLEQTEQDLDSTFNQLNRELEEEEQNIRDEGEQVEQDVEQGLENTEEDMEEAGEDMDRNAEEIQDTLQGDQQPMDQDPGNQAGLTAEDIEVLESKEGPNHEVVYRINGDLFYVDRDKKELIKVKRSDLKDSKHEVQIKEAIASGDDSKMKNKRSKG